MARYGTSYGAGYGNPENHCEYGNLEVLSATRARYRFKPRSGWGDAWFSVYNNAVRQGNIYCPEGVEQIVNVLRNPGKTQLSVIALRIGHAAWPDYNIPRVARTFEHDDSQRVTALWNWTPSTIGSIDEGGFLTSWTVTGVKRSNTIPVSMHPSWSYLKLEMTVSAGTATITLSNDSGEVASGSGAVGGAVALTASNSSGIAVSSVTVNALATTQTGAKLLFRWPASMKVLRDTSDPPSTVVATIPFNGVDDGSWTEASDLAAGTYYYRLQSYSETGDTGDSTSSFTNVINGPPVAPTNLAYSSGSAAALTLSFTGSTTGGATYRAYVSGYSTATGQGVVGSAINIEDIAATAIAGATTITLPAITGYAGTVRVILRAVNAGVEEKNGDVLDIELDGSGNRVAPRPNTPTIALETITWTGGRTITFNGSYDTAEEAGTATTLKLYTRTPTGSYGASVATGTLAAVRDGLKGCAISYTFPGNGAYYIQLKASTAGSVLSLNGSNEVLVYPSDANMPAPDNASFSVSRG